uniref:C1q domain-containing protein n=1 Tax=Seriola dumerili TaxID=41447 RepID=A0A3B4TIP7_SERDU
MLLYFLLFLFSLCIFSYEESFNLFSNSLYLSVQGPPGDMGTPGVPGINDGMGGAEGRPGEKGAKGDKGDIGGQGLQGPIGPKGNQGIIGLIGPPGPCSPAIQSAFTALINQSFPTSNWPIAFPIVITNQQGHFNPLAGIYTAPVNGTYVFSYNLAVAFRMLKVGLFRNLYPVIRTTEGNDQATTSQTIVLHLTMGDQVWLQVKNSETNGLHTDTESSSTFSGYLLHPDSFILFQTKATVSEVEFDKHALSAVSSVDG